MYILVSLPCQGLSICPIGYRRSPNATNPRGLGFESQPHLFCSFSTLLMFFWRESTFLFCPPVLGLIGWSWPIRPQRNFFLLKGRAESCISSIKVSETPIFYPIFIQFQAYEFLANSCLSIQFQHFNQCDCHTYKSQM